MQSYRSVSVGFTVAVGVPGEVVVVNSLVRGQLVTGGPPTMKPTFDRFRRNPVNTGTFSVGDTLRLA